MALRSAATLAVFSSWQLGDQWPWGVLSMWCCFTWLIKMNGRMIVLQFVCLIHWYQFPRVQPRNHPFCVELAYSYPIPLRVYLRSSKRFGNSAPKLGSPSNQPYNPAAYVCLYNLGILFSISVAQLQLYIFATSHSILSMAHPLLSIGVDIFTCQLLSLLDLLFHLLAHRFV